MTLVRGVDISSAQTVTLWPAVGKAVDFVIVKATEGVTYTSPTWTRYYRAAADANILRGSYHFAHPANSALAEARHYVAALKDAGFKSGHDLPPCLDIESTGGRSKATLTTWCLTFLHEVDRLLALTVPWLKTGVYLNGDYFRNRMDGAKVCDGRWRWLASWPVRNAAWPDESTRPSSAVWQFTDRMRINGITENVDGDVARLVDLHSLAPLFYTIPVPPAPPQIPTIPVSRVMVNPHRQSVAYLQRALNKTIGADVHGGFHDARTSAAVKKYQAKLGHTQTGSLTSSEWLRLAQDTGQFIANP